LQGLPERVWSAIDYGTHGVRVGDDAHPIEHREPRYTLGFTDLLEASCTRILITRVTQTRICTIKRDQYRVNLIG